jgi:stage IV sporulation protein B
MKRIVKCLVKILTVLTVFVFTLIYFGQSVIPDKITLIEGEKYDSPKFLGIKLFSVSELDSVNINNSKSINTKNETQVSLLNIIPVKTSDISTSKRKYVVLGGEIFGIKLYTDGIVVVSTDTVDTENGTVNPSEIAGIKVGDIIKSIDGAEVKSTSHLIEIIQKSNGEELDVGFVRNDKYKTTKLQPLKDKISGEYKAGIWVRDSTAGLGTVTFYDNETNTFAGLGHAVYDVDTENIMPIKYGEMADAYVSKFYKSSNGNIGELCGVFTGKSNGTLYMNDETGIYGITNTQKNGTIVPVAVKQEIKEGDAQILCTIDNEAPKFYSVKIIKIDMNSNKSHQDMVIEITDKELLEKTGGIVQGMSGAPIVQNGMLVGAVTHVFVNNPKQGYGIFAETMLEKTDTLKIQLKKAS